MNVKIPTKVGIFYKQLAFLRKVKIVFYIIRNAFTNEVATKGSSKVSHSQ
jgi:hypothetical protein